MPLCRQVWFLGQQGKAPPEDLRKMHAEVSNNFLCIKYICAMANHFDDKSKVKQFEMTV